HYSNPPPLARAQPTTTPTRRSSDPATQSQFDALRQYPADGSFVTGAPTGRVYHFAGGAPLYIDNWAPFGGAQPTITVNDGTIEAIASAYYCTLVTSAAGVAFFSTEQ